MLTGDLVRPRLRVRKGRLSVTMLDAKKGQATAHDLIQLFRQHLHKTQGQWDKALEAYEGDRIDYIVVRGLAKVLTDAATFEYIDFPIAPVELRQQLFAHGPVFAQGDLFHPTSRADLLTEFAAKLQLAPEHIELLLYADLPAQSILTEIGAEWTPLELIQRYNLELARAALYWSDRMEIDIYDTFKDFWRYMKLFKLMFWATPIDGGYHVELDGPVSPFVKATTRYGRQFAAFLPALFLCSRWQMSASVQQPSAAIYSLDDTSPLRSHFQRSPLFDSRLESDFAAEFEAKFGSERGKWLLTREDEVLLLGDTVMIPDFALTHKQDGRRALIEIVGFWHPEYLRRKLEKARLAGRRNLLLLVYEGVNLTEDRLHDLPNEVLYFKKKPVLKDVLAAVERIAE